VAATFTVSEYRVLADYLVGYDFSNEIFEIIRNVNGGFLFEQKMTKVQSDMFFAALWEYMT
jgi:hypothetical protein